VYLDIHVTTVKHKRPACRPHAVVTERRSCFITNSRSG